MRVLPFLVVCAACGGGSTGDLDAQGADAWTVDTVDTPDAALALCQRSGLVFCEDFEALPTGAATNATSAAWDVEAANGALAIDATHSRGTRAIKLATTGNGRARLVVTGLALPDNSAWGVVHAWVSEFPSAPDYAHYTMVELAGTGTSTLVRPIGGQYAPAGGANQPAGAFWGVGSDGGPTGDWTNWRRSAPSMGGRWVCLEFHLDGPTDGIAVYLDGVAQPDLGVTHDSHGGTQSEGFDFPAFDRIWFGWWLYQSNPTPAAYDVWLDDLALAPDRLGCE